MKFTPEEEAQIKAAEEEQKKKQREQEVQEEINRRVNSQFMGWTKG